MPCMYDPSPAEIRAGEEARQKALDKLTQENDMLREFILSLVEEGTLHETQIPARLRKDQEQHRREDLKRLKKTFSANKDYERLGRVVLADPRKPLEEQLGFNPDDF